MSRRQGPWASVLCAVALASLVALSVWLAVHRIYQVDEAQNVYSARLAALGLTGEFQSTGSLLIVGPLSWIAGRAATSVEIFTRSRLLLVGLFWLNLSLVPIAMGFRPRRASYWWALLGTATLAPLWDYGFEVRHDNLMLTLLLLLWIVVRSGSSRPRAAYALLGALAATLQAVAFKSFVFWIPVSLGALAFPPAPDGQRGRARLGAAWLAGFAAGALVLGSIYRATGLWTSFQETFAGLFSVSQSAKRFSPLGTLARLVDEAPLLVVLALATFVVVGIDWRRRGAVALDREGPLPDLLLCLLALGALLLNPTPFPYNLLHLVPFMVLPLRRAGLLFREMAPRLSASTPVLALLVTCHVTPFIRPVLRHLEWTNDRQKEVMGVAESLTDPASDRVYDGVGLVPTRRTIGRSWFLHSLLMPGVRAGALPSPSEMLAANPASVIIRSYRTDWLLPKDVAWIQAHYVALSDEVLVLGAVLPPGGGRWECIHAGSYALLLYGGADPASGGSIFLDGRPLPAGSRLRIEKGVHTLAAGPAERVLVLWTGPRAVPPQLGPGDHRRLFFNWY